MCIFIASTVCFCFAADYRCYGFHTAENCSYQVSYYEMSLSVAAGVIVFSRCVCMCPSCRTFLKATFLRALSLHSISSSNLRLVLASLAVFPLHLLDPFSTSCFLIKCIQEPRLLKEKNKATSSLISRVILKTEGGNLLHLGRIT